MKFGGQRCQGATAATAAAAAATGSATTTGGIGAAPIRLSADATTTILHIEVDIITSRLDRITSGMMIGGSTALIATAEDALRM